MRQRSAYLSQCN